MKSRLTAAPYLLWMALFIIVPMGLVGYFAFTDLSGHFSLKNFEQSFAFAPVIFTSIWLAIVSTVICLILAYPLAYYMSRKSASKQRTYLMLIMLPMWMSFLLRTYAWMTILENNGVLNSLLKLIGLGPFEMINTPGAVVLGMVYNYIPFMILPLYSVMTKIDDSFIQAAQDLGCNSMQVLKNVILPLSMPGVSTGITMVFVPAVSTFVISRMLGGGSTMLIGDLIETQFLGNAYNPNLGSALSIVLMLIILICMALTDMFTDVEEKGGMMI